VAFFLQRGEREHHVLRRELAAVVETRLRPQQKAVGQPVGRDAHRARRQPVHRVGLVLGTHHQTRECQLHALRGVAAQDVAVERIEGQRVLIVDRAGADLREHAALRRFRIDVIEVREIGRIFQVAERRYAVPLGFRARLGLSIEPDHAGRCGACAKAKKPPARKSDHERDPTLAALA
jgi:hypothetical protein